jgi:hypothetical protein
LFRFRRDEFLRDRNTIRVFDVFQNLPSQNALDNRLDAFTERGKIFFRPQEAEIPRLEAQVDILKVNNLSAAEIASQASNLYDHWQTMQPEPLLSP